MRKVIKKEYVRVDDTPGALPSSGGQTTHNDSQVRIIRAGGRVTAIEYTCSCGDRATLEFEYGALPAVQSQQQIDSVAQAMPSEAE